MTLDLEDINAIAEAVAAKINHRNVVRDEADFMARLIKEGRGAEVQSMQRQKLLRSKRPA